MSSLDHTLKKQVQVNSSTTGFKFGDGRKVYSTKKVQIPAMVAGKMYKIEADIIAEDIPLLLSKNSLKKADAVIDMKNDKAFIFGKEVKLHLFTSVHYCIDIDPSTCKVDALPDITENVFVSESSLSHSDSVKQVERLHKQFGHAWTENLKRLIKNTGEQDAGLMKIIDEVVQACDVCRKYKKPVPRPTVGLSRAEDFNHSVALDLHELGPNLWYLHMIDEFTRFSNAVLIREKYPVVIIRNFLKFGVSIFGAPKKVFSDNGGEFIGEEFYEICEAFNIKVSGTPSYSPWSNGLCERHNRTLTETLLEVKEDTKSNWETALAWAVCAKNAMISNNGFSPYQLVFGRNTNLPSTFTDKLPAPDGQPRSFTVGNHITALQAFVATESSEKIKRALRKQTRPSGHIYQVGEEVYYKRDDNNKWRGLGRALGQDGPVVFVRHGSRYVKAHICRIQPASSSDIAADNTKVGDRNYPMLNSVVEENTGIAKEKPTAKDLEYSDNDSDEEQEVQDQVLGDMQPQNETQIVSSSELASENNIVLQSTHLKLNKKSVIEFSLEDGNRYKAKILNRAGKSTGLYKNAYNIEYTSPEHLCGKKSYVDLDRVKDLSVS